MSQLEALEAQRRQRAPLAAQRLIKRHRAVGPTAYLAAERARLAAMTWRDFEIRPVGATIGAELHGIDLAAELPDETIAEIAAALAAYKVIFFRDQVLTAHQHVAFARRFGELEIHPFVAANQEVPELVRFEKSAAEGGYENAWHHDVTWREIPSMGAILRSIDVPASGGDTLFADMYAAYESLDEPTKSLIDGLDATHDFLAAFSARLTDEQIPEKRKEYPVVTHPVVARHPVTGRKHLYVNCVFTTGIVGPDGPWESDRAEELLGMLFERAEIIEHQCRFRWEPNSVAFWDNRAVQHYAASDYWPDVRVMERASIIGSHPTR